MNGVEEPPSLKPLYWVGSSKRDLRSLPGPVEDLFQKKSTRGVATPKADIELIRERLKVSEQIAKELSR